jgi:hypothetical protein
MCIYMCIYICTCTYVYLNRRICIYTALTTAVGAFEIKEQDAANVAVYKYAYMCIYKRVYVCAYVYIYTYVYLYIYIYTYKRIHKYKYLYI